MPFKKNAQGPRGHVAHLEDGTRQGQIDGAHRLAVDVPAGTRDDRLRQVGHDRVRKILLAMLRLLHEHDNVTTAEVRLCLLRIRPPHLQLSIEYAWRRVLLGVLAPVVLLTQFSFVRNQDIYWVPAWAVLLGVPLAAAATSSRRGALAALLFGVAILGSFATSVRSQAGLPLVIAALVGLAWVTNSWRARTVMR